VKHPPSRTIFLNNDFGYRQAKEVIAGTLMALSQQPQGFWLVSPWVTDFDLLDNRAKNWSNLNPAWEARKIRFYEVLIFCLESGCEINLVTLRDGKSDVFLNRLLSGFDSDTGLSIIKSEKLHLKGLLTRDIWVAGSLNFTYSGLNRNQEQVVVDSNPDTLLEAKLEFDHLYGGFII